MNVITLIINLIIALPKIYEIIKELKSSLEKMKKNNQTSENYKAFEKIRNATTQEERQNAADDFLDNN